MARGVSVWWNGWYGGISTAPYSLLTAPLMQTAGVVTVGIAATAVTAVTAMMAARLAVDCLRPRRGAGFPRQTATGCGR